MFDVSGTTALVTGGFAELGRAPEVQIRYAAELENFEGATDALRANAAGRRSR